MTELLIRYLDQVIAIAPTWGYVLIVFFMTIESSFIPFPSEVVMIPAGFLAARGSLTMHSPGLDATLAVVAGVVGSLLGALINYVLFRRLGRPFLDRYGKYFFLPPDALARAESLFLQYGVGATFFCRLLPGIRQLISIPAGLAGMPMRSFLLWTGLGAGLWVALLTAVGYAVGARTGDLDAAGIVHQGKALLSQYTLPIFAAAALLLVGYVLLKRRVMKG
ncbi:MAG: DedA family protein [Polyangiales bacterium]